MNLFHRLAIGGALSLLAESAAAIGAVASQPQSDNITFAPARSAEEPAVTACYWFDQQDDRYPLAPGVSMIDTGMLPAGFHALHAQIMGDGIPTSIETSWFVKTFSLSPDQTYTINIYIDGSLYTSMTTQADEDGIMNFNIDVNDLPLGMHTIMGQVIAPDGVPTSLAQSTFVRVPSEAQLGDGIACYWFDQQQERHPLSPGVNLIDTGSLPAGFHAVHAQIVSNGIPTSIETAWFMKTFQLTPGQAYTTNIYIDGSLYTSMSTPIGEDGTMSLSVDVNDLPVGIHSIMGQVISPEGVPTSLAQGTFLRVPTEAQLGNGTAFYWFDQQEERYPLSPGVNLIDTGSLPAGFHAVHAQISCDGLPTSIETAWFIKALNLSTDQEYTTNIYIDGSLYATETAQAGEDGTMSLNIDVSSLPVGMHTIMGQVISREGVPTSLAVGAFLRVPMDTQSDRLKLFYLIDGIQSGEVPDIRPGEVYSLDIDVASLPTGVHSISSFLAGANGLATAVETAWFVKIPVGGEGVKRYRYWLNENPSTMREVVLDKVTDPTEIVSMIDMPLEPFCSLRYEFAVEDGKPAVYAQNDYQMLFIDLGGRFTMGSGRYTDVRVRQDVTPAGVIPDNALTKVEGLGENEIRFYTFPGYAGDSISVSLNGKAMCEVYSPRGNTLIALDGTETEKGPMIGLTEKGTYYLAVHDISSSGNSVIIDFHHIANLNAGDDFEYQGIIYTIMDAAAKTCKTKDGDRIKDPDNPGEYIDAPGNTFEGDLIIPEKVTDGVDEYTVTEIGSAGFYDCDGITSVSLPSTLLSIGEKGFADCDGISSLDLPNSITTIDSYAFMGCPNLGSVNLPDNLANVGEGAFRSCRSLTSVTLPESLATVSSGMFYGCSSLSSVQFPSSLRKIDAEAFGYCGNIQEAVLPDGLTAIAQGAFYGCSGLVNLVMPESLDYIGVNAFCGCSSLQSLNLPDNLKDIDDEAFRNCTALTSVTLPAYMQRIGQQAFANSNAIVKVNYGAVHPIVASENIFSGAVYETATLDMPNATLADIRATMPWSRFGYIVAKDGTVTPPLNAGEEFEYEGITYTVVDPESKTCRTKDGSATDPGNDSTGDLVIPQTASDGNGDKYTVTGIGSRGFYNCGGLTSVTLPASLQTIGDEAFGNCNAIDTVSYAAAMPVEASDNVFSAAVYETATLKMRNATLADIRATMPWSLFGYIVAKDGTVTPSLNAGEEFEFEGITYTVVDPEAKTCRTKDGSATDPGNASTGDLVIPQTASDGKDDYTVIGIGSRGFYNCGGLTSVTLPASLQTIGDRAFGNCNAIATVSYAATMPVVASDNVFSAAVYETATLKMPNATLADIQATLPWSRFGNIEATDGTVTPSLKAGEDFEYEQITYTVVDPESKTCRTKDGSATDPGNDSSGDLVIPQTASDGKDNYTVIGIGSRGFYNCGGLTSVTLPTSLLTIGDEAFGNCNAIDTVSYAATMPVEAADNVFSEVAYETAKLKMPNATLADIRVTLPWSLFGNIVAKDGTVTPPLNAGEDFKDGDITYTVVDSESRTCRTKDGTPGNPGNECADDLVIPQTVSDGNNGYTVVGIGAYGFYGSGYLTSVTLPESVEAIGDEAFAGCQRLTSVVWTAQSRMPESMTDAIANPNLLVYVTDKQYAPAGMSDNVVVMDMETGTAECQRLVLQPGYPFRAVRTFDALYSTMTKEFTQITPIGGCEGWETIVLPFDATSVAVNDARGELTPFALILPDVDISTLYPYWLYEATTGSESGNGSKNDWTAATEIKAGVPYLIAMPNSPDYAARYRIDGPVTFSNPGRTTITPETTAPYAVTWASGREFRPLWLPLDATEADDAMGLNVGMDNLTDDEGHQLAPGSAFHVDVEPRPLEAYVTRIDARRSLPVMGGQSSLPYMTADGGLTVTVENGTIYVSSSSDRRIELYCVDGLRLGSFDVKGGEPLTIKGLIKGVYIVAGKKVIIK